MTALRIDIVRRQLEQLKLRHPDLFGDEDNWDLTLASETDLDEALASLVAQERHTAALAGALASQRAEMDARLERFQRRGKAIRDLMCGLMLAANVRKRELPLATVSVSKGRTKLVIENDGVVPVTYCKQVLKPDTDKIRQALDTGEALNWASLVRGDDYLTIRTK